VKRAYHMTIYRHIVCAAAAVGLVWSAATGTSAFPARPATETAALAVTAALNESAAAFEHGDLARASKVWSHSEALTVFEGGHVNNGWADYRDNHLGPEMKELRAVRYRLSNITPHVVNDTAWATFRYAISGSELRGRTFAGTGIGTAVLERQGGAWRIVHWHSTSTPKAKVASPAPQATS
jgi:ketosteroid isomerase-like protein